MSYCKNHAIICDRCGFFCIPYDEETPYGCKNYENPEPLDPYHFCKKCAKLEYKQWMKKFKNGCKVGNWQKSNAEQRAAEKSGLVWVDSYGEYGKPGYKSHCYIPKEIL